MHSAQDVLLGRLTHRVLLVVGEQDHVLPLVSKVLNQVRGHVAHVIDAASQLAALAEVVDANEQGLPAAIALRVLECIVGGGAGAKVLWGGWGWARSMAVIRVRVRYVCVASILLEGGVCPRGLVPVCSDGEEQLTWTAVLALGRRVVAVLLLRWGLWNTSTVSNGRRGDAMSCGLVRRGWIWGARREVSRTYPTVETVGLRRGLIAVARLGRRGVAVVVLLLRTGAQGNAVVSGGVRKREGRVMSGQTREAERPQAETDGRSHTGSSPGRRGRLLAGARRRTRFGSRDSQT